MFVSITCCSWGRGGGKREWMGEIGPRNRIRVGDVHPARKTTSGNKDLSTVKKDALCGGKEST